MLNHLREVAHDDVADVRKLKAKYLGPTFQQKAGDADMGDIIIADDINIHQPSVNPGSSGKLIAGAAALALTAVAAGLTGWFVGRPQITPPTASPASSTKVQVQTRFNTDTNKHEQRWRQYPDGTWSDWAPWDFEAAK